VTPAAVVLGAGRKRICVIGTGIAGLLAARLLSSRHDVTVYEQDDRLGGHTHTVDVTVGANSWAIDTGFIVHNERNYPNLVRILAHLGVVTQPTRMSFSMRCERTGLEYCGSSLNQMFAQRSNLLRPSFYGMLLDIMRFHRDAQRVLQRTDEPSLLEVLAEGRYGAAFIERYLVPMGAAIWSADPAQLRTMPARFFLQFFHNHGMLQIRGRPLWRTVRGGSRAYLGPLTAPFAGKVRLSAKVTALRRTGGGVRVEAHGQPAQQYDGAIVATHSDQALSLLADPSEAERSLLAAVSYQENEVVLHTDERLLPRRRRAWAGWNYLLPSTSQDRVAVTYCMNLLQDLPPAAPTFCVTLNHSAAIDPSKVLRRFRYHHPVFTSGAVAAQQRLPMVNGVARVWFCGAWCGYGFHEDGVVSALKVAHDFGLSLDDLGAHGRQS
jgi:predicted NAD/FAD-binding protein